MSSQTQTTPAKTAAKKPKVPKAPKKPVVAPADEVPAAAPAKPQTPKHSEDTAVLSPTKPSVAAAEKKTRGKKAAVKSESAAASPVKKAESPKAETPVASEISEEEMVAESLAEVVDTVKSLGSPDLLDKIDVLCKRIVSGDLTFKKIPHELKLLKKDVVKLQKASKKKEKGKKRVNSQLSGIQKPGKLTKEMYEFTGWDIGKEYSRVDVTKHICHYIREHQLQNPDDKRLIMIDRDPKLSRALGYKEGVDPKLSYPLIQRFIKVAVTKPTAVMPDEEAPAEAE